MAATIPHLSWRAPRFSVRLVEALQSHGFAYITESPITPSTVASTLNWAKAVFSLPLEDKLKMETLNGRRGYYRYIGEALESDNIEAMNIERPDIADMNELRREYYQLREFPDSIIPKNARNQWPSKLPDFQSAAADYFDLAQAVSMQLIAHVCAGLNLPKQVTDTLLGFHNLNDSNLEYKRYPGVPQSMLEEGGDFRIAPHLDASTLTILIQDAMGGLEVLDSTTDSWLRVPARDDAILVNSGRFLQLWTNGEIPATLHRVSHAQPTTADHPHGSDRVSVVFFCTPNWTAELFPLAAVHTRNQQVEDLAAEQDSLVGDLMPV